VHQALFLVQKLSKSCLYPIILAIKLRVAKIKRQELDISFRDARNLDKTWT